jgi:hypothetical protein
VLLSDGGLRGLRLLAASPRDPRVPRGGHLPIFMHVDDGRWTGVQLVVVKSGLRRGVCWCDGLLREVYQEVCLGEGVVWGRDSRYLNRMWVRLYLKRCWQIF